MNNSTNNSMKLVYQLLILHIDSNLLSQVFRRKKCQRSLKHNLVRSLPVHSFRRNMTYDHHDVPSRSNMT